MPAVYVSGCPPRRATTSVIAVPAALVFSLTTWVLVTSVTFEWARAGRTASTSASDFAWTRHGKPSQSSQRTQALHGMFASFSMMPHGE